MSQRRRNLRVFQQNRPKAEFHSTAGVCQKSNIGELLDHLVGAKGKLWRYLDAQRFGGVGVNDQFNLR